MRNQRQVESDSFYGLGGDWPVSDRAPEVAFIYALAGPSGVFYVGRTKSPLTRKRDHLRCYSGQAGWAVREIRERGGEVRFLVLDCVPPGASTPHEVEQRWMRHARSCGARLVNREPAKRWSA